MAQRISILVALEGADEGLKRAITSRDQGSTAAAARGGLMIPISFDAEIRKTIADLEQYDKQVNYAVAVALTRTAKRAQAELVAEMRKVFQNPTSFTLNSLYVKSATKYNQVAYVGIKDWAVKAIPPIRWLSPQVYGGTRELKRSEELLRAAGVLPPGMYIVPGQKARMNKAGNMSSGQIQQILSALRVARNQDARINRTIEARQRRSNALLRDQGSQLTPAAWDLATTRQAPRRADPDVRAHAVLRPRLNFEQVTKAAALRYFRPEFDRALAEAIATAR